MKELTEWFDVVTDAIRETDPNAFLGIDLNAARQQIETAAHLTQPPKEPFTQRNTYGSSGQTDSS